jgi:hypothetical protein
VHDIDLANRVASFSGEAPSAEVQGLRAEEAEGGYLSPTDASQLRAILGTPPHNGIGSLLERPERADLLAPTATPDELKSAMEKSVESILHDSSKASATTFKGLIGVPADKLISAAGETVQHVFDEIMGKVGLWLRKAAKLVLQAIEKCLAVFGSSTAAIRTEIAKWTEGLSADKVEGLLASVYGSDTIKHDLGQLIDAHGAAVCGDHLASGVAKLEGISGSLHKQMWVIEKLAWVLGKARGWLMAQAPPYGAIGVLSAYTVGTGYAVCAGGDYLDWSHIGVFDLVPGVQRVVNQTLDEGKAAPDLPAAAGPPAR